MLIFRWFAYFSITFALLTSNVYGQTIEIKGLSIGLSKAEVEQKFPSWSGFTIAGASAKYPHSPLETSYVDGKLDSLFFFFEEDSFAVVLAAVKQKYPNISCVESQVGNAMGAKFTQIECTISDRLSTLQLTRFISDIWTSSLTLTSRRLLEEASQKAKKNKKDL